MQAVTIVDQAGVKPAVLARAERAIEGEVNGPVARQWQVGVTFTPTGGWPIFLTKLPLPQGDGGFHVIANPLTSSPTAVVQWTSDQADDTELLDHEVIETLVDPYGGRPEVCDPVESRVYRDAPTGIWLEGFVGRDGRLYPQFLRRRKRS